MQSKEHWSSRSAVVEWPLCSRWHCPDRQSAKWTQNGHTLKKTLGGEFGRESEQWMNNKKKKQVVGQKTGAESTTGHMLSEGNEAYITRWPVARATRDSEVSPVIDHHWTSIIFSLPASNSSSSVYLTAVVCCTCCTCKKETGTTRFSQYSLEKITIPLFIQQADSVSMR